MFHRCEGFFILTPANLGHVWYKLASRTRDAALSFAMLAMPVADTSEMNPLCPSALRLCYVSPT